MRRYADWTHAQKQALVLLDGAQAAEEARYHDDGADGDDHVGGRQRGERGREGGEAALGHREPDAHAEQPAAAQLQGRKDETGNKVRKQTGG